MATVTKFYPKNGAKDPNQVLELAKGGFKSVFIAGWDEEGILDVRSSTNLDQKEILWLIEVFKHKLLNGDYAPD